MRYNLTLMVSEGNKVAFAMLKSLRSIFEAAPSTVGASDILDIYHDHKRGPAFTYLILTSLLKTVIESTFSDFILSGTSWPVEC